MLTYPLQNFYSYCLHEYHSLYIIFKPEFYVESELLLDYNI